MAKAPDGDFAGFDLDKFRRLLQLMEKYGVTETQLRKGDESWKVRRGPQQVTTAPDALFAPPVAAAPPRSVGSDPAGSSGGGESSAPSPRGVTIDAPTVGTFYPAASPEDEPFVSVGSTIKADSIVCIIEAMKVFNQIPAEKEGRIVEILVENGDPVEFGQPLFRIKPA